MTPPAQGPTPDDPTRTQAHPTHADDDAMLEAMVAHWFASQSAGQSVDLDRLCRERPDLLPTLRQLLGLARSLPGTEVEAPRDPLLGRALGDRYRLTARLGAGGMGMVYAARDEQLGRDVAVKVLDELFAADAQRVERFRREARSLAALDDPHIVAVHDFELTSHPPYLVMDRVVGFDLAVLVRTLRDHVPEPQSPTPTQVKATAAACAGVTTDELGDAFARPWPQLVATLAVQMARALAAAHDVGVVHRDVKPSNFMTDVAGRVRLLDFGLARRDIDVTLTRSDTRVGTPLYMAPEQVRGEEATVACDVYSLGATLYELTCLRPPFAGRGGELEAAILHDEPVPPQRVRARLPHDLGAIALKALHKTAPRRYATATEVAEELDRFLRFEPVMAQTRVLPAPLRAAVGVFRRYRRLAILAASAIALVSVVALGAGRLLGERHGRIAADTVRAESLRLHAALSPYLAFAAGREDRLRDAGRPTQLAMLDQLIELVPGDDVARFLRLWTRGEEDPVPATVADDRDALHESLGAERLTRLYERVALPVQQRNRTDRIAGRDAMLAALAQFDDEPQPLDAVGRRLQITTALQLVEYDPAQRHTVAARVLELTAADENANGRTAFTCFARGVARQIGNDTRGARDAMVECDRLCPDQPSTLYNLARASRLLGQPERARHYLDAALAMTRTPHVNFLDQYARTLIALQDFASVEPVLQRFPDDLDSRVRAATTRTHMKIVQATLSSDASVARDLLAAADDSLAELTELARSGRMTARQTAVEQGLARDLTLLRTGTPAACAHVCLNLLRDPTTGAIDDPLNHAVLARLGDALRQTGDDVGDVLLGIAAALERLEHDGVRIR